jgi:hypothetical protein
MKTRSSAIASLLLCVAASMFGQPSRAPGLDGQFVDLVSRIPGFGGYFFDAQGDLNVYLTDTSHEGVARAVLADVARNRPQRLNNPWTRPSEILVRHGEFDFEQLDTWHRRIATVLAGINVTMIDSDEAANKVSIGVAHESDRQPALALITAAGIPREAVLVDVIPPVQQATTLRDNVRPLIGGLQVAWGPNQYPCTLGVNVWYGNSAAGIPSGTPGFYTASHCSTSFGQTDGTAFTQSGESIGREQYDPPYFTNAQYSGCPIYNPGIPSTTYKCRWSDVLFVGYNAAGLNRSQGVVATTDYPNSGSIVIWGQATYNSILPYPTVGQVLNKIGSTTGWTSGAVRYTCRDYPNYYTGTAVLCQDEVSGTANYGDSGSPVFQNGYPNTAFAGILWGMTSDGTGFIYSNVNRIAQEMGGSVTYTP